MLRKVDPGWDEQRDGWSFERLAREMDGGVEGLVKVFSVLSVWPDSDLEDVERWDLALIFQNVSSFLTLSKDLNATLDLALSVINSTFEHQNAADYALFLVLLHSSRSQASLLATVLSFSGHLSVFFSLSSSFVFLFGLSGHLWEKRNSQKPHDTFSCQQEMVDDPSVRSVSRGD